LCFFHPIPVFLFSCIIALEVLSLSLLMARYKKIPKMRDDGRRRMEVWNRTVTKAERWRGGLGLSFSRGRWLFLHKREKRGRNKGIGKPKSWRCFFFSYHIRLSFLHFIYPYLVYVCFLFFLSAYQNQSVFTICPFLP